MNPLIQLKNAAPLFLAVFGLSCFALSPALQAVTPAPDGGYAGGNTAEGRSALLSLTSGTYNTAVGVFSLLRNNTANFNTAVGAGALLANTGGSNNAGNNNTATGAGALLSNTTGLGNTANGAFALSSNTIGSANTAVGDRALGNNTTGDANTALGIDAGFNVTTANAVICIGAIGADIDNSCFIGNIRGVTTAIADAIPVLIDSAGQLGTMNSSRRYKTDIKPIDKASECVLGLKPVSFRYKVHKDSTPQFGLIAEEVAEVNRDLVIYDADGKPYTVRYDAVNAMLLNEFLKAHKTMQEQGATITRQQKQIEALTAGLQKVSAQLEVSKPAPQTALNNQ